MKDRFAIDHTERAGGLAGPYLKVELYEDAALSVTVWSPHGPGAGTAASCITLTPTETRNLIAYLTGGRDDGPDLPTGGRDDGPDITPKKIYEAAIRDNNENLRWWKEGYGEGYATGFDNGREYQLEQ